MKIGILTYHRAHNYGAMLQAYALLSYLRNNGHDVEIIDYWPDMHKVQYALIKPIVGNSIISKIKCIIATTITFIRRYMRICKFEKFSQKYLNINSTIQYPMPDWGYLQYDCVIVGSDQIWRNHESDGKHIGFDPVYFCQHIPQNIRCISYAASMGIIQLNKEDKDVLKNYLNRFSRILVRENSLKEAIDELGFESAIVVDPTLLLSQDEWNKFLPNKRFHTTKYVLYYELVKSKEALVFAKHKAEELGCKLLIMDATIPLIPQRRHISYASPIEFLHAIRDAEFVIATSFHGTAFSVIFEKQFITIGLKKNADRVQTMLHQLDIEEHYQEHPQNVMDIDYAQVKIRFSKLVANSMHLLLTSICK